jgi:signal transduction histidine kinase
VKYFGAFRRRVLAHGLLLMLLMAGAVAVADRLFVNRWVEHELLERRARVNSEISVYGPDGALLASKVEPPVSAPPKEVLARLASGAPPTTVNDVVVTGMFRDGKFAGAVARQLPPPLAPYPGPPLPLVLLTLGVCIAATLLASIPLSRAIVHPVEALARSVKRFGAGELGARASLRGGDEIGDLAAAFDDMATRIESLVRKEKRLLADVSHELRTPLARIRVVLELASDGDPERVRSYLGEIAQDLAELEMLVDDVLASARLDAARSKVVGGAVPMHWTQASVAEIVERARARFARLHPGQPLSVDAEVDGLAIECDKGLLRRAIDNLLDNAAKHAPGASVELRAVRADDGGVTIQVADDGPGMSAEGAARAFEPFFREDVSRDRRTGGVGLGLSIVRTIVEAHGGRVSAESAPGRGTKIAIVLPAQRPT